MEELKKGATTLEGNKKLNKWKKERLKYVASCDEVSALMGLLVGQRLTVRDMKTKKAYEAWAKERDKDRCAEKYGRERRRVERYVTCWAMITLV